MNKQKYKCAISDTDILIDLFKSDALNILQVLFEEIHITEYIYEKELKRVANRLKIDFAKLDQIITNPDRIFEIKYDNQLDISIKKIKKVTFNERKIFVGPGEADCAAYSHASGINFVVSNNHNEFEFLDDICIPLSYTHLLTICCLHKKMTFNDAKNIYNKVNRQKERPSGQSFKKKFEKSKQYIKENNYTKKLNLVNCEI
jgi:predicted nucleic acid-binding protein